MFLPNSIHWSTTHGQLLMPRAIRLKLLSLFFGLFIALFPGGAHSQPMQPDRWQGYKREASDIAVSIVVSGLACTCARFAEDIRNVVNDPRPDGMRVLPLLGLGGFQNVHDILFLRGVDMGIVDQDNLKLLKQREPALYRNIKHKIHYITKLYNSELHVLAHGEVKSLADLEGRAVNFSLPDSQTHVTAENVFNILQIRTQQTFFDNDLALHRLIGGEIAAMVVLAAPQATLAKVRKEDRLHFVPISVANLPRRVMDAMLDDYLPAEHLISTPILSIRAGRCPPWPMAHCLRFITGRRTASATRGSPASSRTSSTRSVSSTTDRVTRNGAK
jgi:TRAP-type uncharacterized transport system substrate-binding protein